MQENWTRVLTVSSLYSAPCVYWHCVKKGTRGLFALGAIWLRLFLQRDFISVSSLNVDTNDERWTWEGKLTCSSPGRAGMPEF